MFLSDTAFKTGVIPFGKIKYLGLVGACLLLGGCGLVLALNTAAGGGTTFSGESTTFGGNNALRNDVLNNIKMVERAEHGCNRIDSVHAEIKNIHRQGEIKIEELWTVQACGTKRSHLITLRPVASGGTMIGIRIPPRK